jgi:phage tail-like protein
MARALQTDFLHSMRFQVVVNGNDVGLNELSTLGTDTAEAGFSAVTTPEATVEAVEYKEGTMVYTRKYPGNPTVSDVTLSRGVARLDSSFWDWLRVVVEGGPSGTVQAEYRVDLDIKHFHRDSSMIRAFPPDDKNATNLNVDTPARTYHVKEAFPIRHKVAGDLDATASEISIMELDVAYEHFEITEHQPPG